MLVGAYDQLNVLKAIYSLPLCQQDMLVLAKIRIMLYFSANQAYSKTQ